MKRSLLAVGAVVVLVAAGGVAWAWYTRDARLPSSVPNAVVPSVTTEGQGGYTVETVATGLDTPWSMAFTSDTRMLVTERPGQLRVIENGELRAEPLHVFAEITERGEDGLMSLALHPNYAENGLVYASLVYAADGALLTKVIRFHDDGDAISGIETILDRIPAAKYHAGCRLAFGPDGMLYVTTGDATDRNIAQDLASLGGKILRVTPDGDVPTDNPFAGSPVWSYGHRNGQGIAWSADGTLYESEHGPTNFDGPPGGDEINRIEKGANYGWPLVSHAKTREGTVAPVVVYTPAEAPASLLRYAGNGIPEFTNHFFFGALVGKGLVHLTPNGDGFASEKLFANEYGRIRDVIEGPDGSIYFTTSNRDGRGSPVAEDDRVIRLIPNR